jgi:hypothetical protein|tara:strand:- start:2230 stop:2550 length:321 start_codon:yes stop_codon:yes gene_type:complete
MAKSSDDPSNEFTKDLLQLIRSSIANNQHLSEAIIRLQEQGRVTEADVGSLLKIIRDGNGRPPLMSRLEALERAVAKEEIDNKMRWDLVLVMAPGLVALLATMMGM